MRVHIIYIYMFWNGLYYNINIDLYVYLYDDMQWLCCRHWWVYFRDPRLWSTVYLHQHRRVVSLPPKGDVLHRIHSGCCRQLHGSVWTFFIDYKSEEFCSLLRFCFIRYKRVRGQRQSLPCWPHLYQHTGFLHLPQEHSLLRERVSSAWERHALWRSVLVQTSGDFWRVVSEMSLFFTLLS